MVLSSKLPALQYWIYEPWSFLSIFLALGSINARVATNSRFCVLMRFENSPLAPFNWWKTVLVHKSNILEQAICYWQPKFLPKVSIFWEKKWILKDWRPNLTFNYDLPKIFIMHDFFLLGELGKHLPVQLKMKKKHINSVFS